MSIQAWRSTVFLVLNLLFGVVWFVPIVVMIALTTALSITVLGSVVGPATVRLWRFAARFERRRIHTLLGVDILPPPVGMVRSDPIPAAETSRHPELPLPSLAAQSAPRRLRRFVTDSAAWRELTYLLLLLPVCTIEFVLCAVLLALTIMTLPFALLFSPILLAGWLHDRSRSDDGAAGRSRLRRIASFFGSFFAMRSMISLTNFHIRFARSFLSRDPNAELQTRVETLTRTRSASVDAALAERRRIERDLHDGAQQRLVKLAMDLGMAQLQMESNPARAQALIAEAHEESKLALTELRNLVRGIHPAILTDRGLDAAISAVADRSRVPIDVDVLVPERLPETVESAAYFVVVEALTNIDKHSGASQARIVIGLANETLTIDVHDNGAGGAETDHGGGLAGLRDRLAALDGVLEIASPRGGPTLVHAEIPCAL